MNKTLYDQKGMEVGTIKEIEEIKFMSSVLCKFKVIEKNEILMGTTIGHKVKLNACQGEPFGQYTPSGSMEMMIFNPEAAKNLIVGTEYFVELRPVSA